MSQTTNKIVALFSLSILDLLFTIILITFFEAQEINPFMLPILNYSPWLFATLKITATLIGCKILYHYQNNKLAKTGINVCLVIYTALLFWHLFLTYSLI